MISRFFTLLFVTLIGLSSCSESDKKIIIPDYVLVIHGGAGTILKENMTPERESAYLEKIGAHRVISIDEAIDTSRRPLLKSDYTGSIDTVGGDILATSIKSVKANGVVTSCGNVASPDLPLTVFPFILRGVTLIGIDSQNCPMVHRRKTWELLAGDWKIEMMNEVTENIVLSELNDSIDKMLKGGHKGRSIISMLD